MPEQVLLNNIEQQYQAALARVRMLPVSFWRNVLIVIALFWICQNLARIVWLILPAPALPAPPVIAVQEVNESGQSSTYVVDLAALQSQKIFGDGVEQVVEEAENKVQAPPSIEDNAAKTQLSLDLVGLIASDIQSESSAVIAQGSNQKIYQIDDTLPVDNNVTLAKILSDRVILNNNGKYESLWLYSEADFNVKYSYSNAAQPAGRPSNLAPQNVVQTKLRPADIPKSISDVVRFSVHREEGQMVGFRIRPGKNRELFERLGLQSNDVVTSVNGIPIDNAEAIRDNYQQLKSATAADLEIRRGEEVVYVNVSLDSTSE